MTQRRQPAAPRTRKAERATEDSVCGRCQTTISVGQPIKRDRTGRAHHADCTRRHVVPVVGPPVERWERPQRPAEQHTCPGCDMSVHPEDVAEAVPVFGTLWHADCRAWAAGRR